MIAEHGVTWLIFGADGGIRYGAQQEALQARCEADAYADAAAWVASHHARVNAYQSAKARAPDPALVEIVAKVLKQFNLADMEKRTRNAKLRKSHYKLRDLRSRALDRLVDAALKK